MNKEEIREIYDRRINLFKEKVFRIKKTLLYLSIFRFLSFIISITFFVYLVKEFHLIRLVAGLAFLVLFIYFIILYIRKTEVLKHYKNLVKINLEEIKVLNNDYSNFYNGDDYINRDHAYSYDLDLFGEGSIYQFLNRTVTLIGRELLAQKLLVLNSKKDRIYKIQDVIKELTSKLEWRQFFMATGLLNPVAQDDNSKINYWLDEPAFYIKRIFYKILVVFLPVITLVFLGLTIAGVSHYSWFALLALTQLFISGIFLRKTNKEQRIVSEELRILKNYSKLIKLIEEEQFKSDLLKDLKTELRTDDTNAQFAFKKLIKIIDAFDQRMNLFMGVILNGLLMWDLYSMMRLERWKLKYGSNVKKWLNVIAEFDVYISFANYSFNNQLFVFPKISDDTVIESKELGHPLIPEEKRVNNNFNLKKLSEIDIITGANMAGKSTFLRTLGVNLILAMNGLTVCASDFSFKIMDIFSGMRTADSLKENESYFYAELKRLKGVIDKLKQGKVTFILLDEILKGTNSVDKAEGSWRFVEHLITLNATGVVATHDLTLCKLEEKYPDHIKNKCFEVEIDAEKIKFDYKLRNGVTQNMNASILMKQMGIFSN